MTTSKQLRLFPERANQSCPTLHRAQVSTGALGEITQVTRAVVGHRVVLQIAPDALDRIELGRIGRKELQRDGSALCFNILAYQPGTMCLQSVPDDQQL